MKKWLNKHVFAIVFTLIVLVILLLGVPCAINLLFKTDFNINFFRAEWSAGDALGYYGAVLSFLGTVVLGALALYQTHMIKTESDAKAEIQEKRMLEENMPKFIVSAKSSNGSCSNLKFEIKNISNNLSTEIKVSDIKIVAPDGTEFWKSEKIYNSVSLQHDDTLRVELTNPTLNENGFTFMAYMQCKDKYDEIHRFMIRGVYYVEKHFPQFQVTEI